MSYDYYLGLGYQPPILNYLVGVSAYYWLLNNRGFIDPSCNIMNPEIQETSQL